MKKIKIDECCTRSEYIELMGYIQMQDFCCICGEHISTRVCDGDGIPGAYIWKEGDFHECEEVE